MNLFSVNWQILSHCTIHQLYSQYSIDIHYTYIYACIHTFMRTYIYAYIRAYVHTYIHTHSRMECMFNDTPAQQKKKKKRSAIM